MNTPPPTRRVRPPGTSSHSTRSHPRSSAASPKVRYLGFVYGTMVALSRMRPPDRGTIVEWGSALGGRSIPLQSAYCGAKHASNVHRVTARRTDARAQRSPYHGRADPRGEHPATWPAPATRRSRPAIRSDPTDPTTCGARRWRQRPRPRRARGLRQQSPRHAPQLWVSHHARLISTATAALSVTRLGAAITRWHRR
jgi:hypothetical protein